MLQIDIKTKLSEVIKQLFNIRHALTYRITPQYMLQYIEIYIC